MVGRLTFGERKGKRDATIRANSHPPPWNRCPCARTGRPEAPKPLRGKGLRPLGLGPAGLPWPAASTYPTLGIVVRWRGRRLT